MDLRSPLALVILAAVVASVALARWLHKTALMVALTIDEEASKIPASHYQLLRDEQALPPSSQLWIGRLDSRDIEAGCWIQRFQWWDREAEPRVAMEGYAFLLAALEVVGLGIILGAEAQDSGDVVEAVRLGPRALERLLRIWPPSGSYSVVWPPRTSLAADDLAELMDQFRRVGES